MNPTKFATWADGLNKMGRPFLTVLITVVYNVTLLVALWMGKLEIREYMSAVGGTNAMIIGFWFGERGARSSQEKETAA